MATSGEECQGIAGASSATTSGVTNSTARSAAARIAWVMGSGSDAGHAHDFFEARNPLGQLAQCALPQRAHAALDGYVLDLQKVFAPLDQIADGVVDRQDLEDARAA